MMKKYISLMRCGFIEGCAYRTNFLTGMLANFIQVIVIYYVWKSVFQFQDNVSGITWEIMKKYIFVSFLCNSTFSFGFELQTANKIIKGDIILDLIKPITYKKLQHFRLVGNAIMEFMLTIFFVGMIYFFVNGQKDMSIERMLLFLCAFILGQEIKSSIQYIFSLACFYTDNGYGIVKARELLTNFFSGALIPIIMFPGSVKKIAYLLPFRGIVNIPCNVLLGINEIYTCIYEIVFQICWIILLKFIGELFWKKVISNISVYGG